MKILTERKCRNCGKTLTDRQKSFCGRKCSALFLRNTNNHGRNKIQKTKLTCLKKFGQTSNFNVPKERKRTIKAKYEKSVQRIKTWKGYVVPEFNTDEFKGFKHKEIYKWKCSRCSLIFQSYWMKTRISEEDEYIPRCPKCFPKKFSGSSREERKLQEFCSGFFNKIICNSSEIISRQLDIYIPSIRTAIEFNGCRWHSQKFLDRFYHLRKTEECQNAGIRLIHIWQDEWLKDSQKIKKWLESIFTGKQKIPKRKTYPRDRYSVLQFKDCQILPPKKIKRRGYLCWNSGYIKLKI